MKKWYLQKAPYRSGGTFWDSYLHYECTLIKTTTENPFDYTKRATREQKNNRASQGEG
jgi:hypothetical protein